MPSYRPPLKLAFADFREGFEPRQSYLFRLIDKHYEIDLEGKPDYPIYSGFGKTHRG